jgi:hypothetical protein
VSDQPSPPDPEPDELPDDAAALRREAATRRRQLREAESARDTLRQRLDTVQRQEVERLAGDAMTDPGDLWLAVSVDSMRGQDRLIDPELAQAQLAEVLKNKPHWKKPETAPESAPTTPSMQNGVRQPPPPPPPSFGRALKDARWQ